MRILYLFLSFFIIACSSQTPIKQSSSRYSMKNDAAPTDIPKLDHIQNAIPKAEKLSRGGNKNYKVWGKKYPVYKNLDQFSQEGYASWYGKKFHGHRTANGEVYDMYKMTAAHKNLPLPSFVKVTNKKNQRSIIVRVNDRGPFHSGRIIDLSYVAAYKLGMLNTGTVPVEIKLIKPNDFKADPKQATAQAKDLKKDNKLKSAPIFYLQVASFSSNSNAIALAKKLNQLYDTDTKVFSNGSLYRVNLGPFSSKEKALPLQSKLKESEFPNTFLTTKAPFIKPTPSHLNEPLAAPITATK